MKLQAKYHPSGPKMFPQVWELLRMYTFVLNQKQKRRGLAPKSQLAVMGAICSRFLLAMRSRIIDEYQEELAARTIRDHGDSLTPRDRAALTSTIPDLPTASRSRSRKPAVDASVLD